MSLFDVCFHTKVGKSSHVNFYRLYKTWHRRTLFFIDNRQFIWFLHKQNRAASTDITFIVTYAELDKTSSVAYCLGETQTCNYYYFLNLAVESIDASEILASVWQEEENFEALKCCYIQIYPTKVLLCYGKAVILFNLCETHSGVMWSSCKRNSRTQLS